MLAKHPILQVEIYDASSKSRTGEANKLKIRDVHPFKDEKGRNNLRLVVRGKTGERDAILRSVAAKRLDKYLTKRRVDEPAGLLFASPVGSQIISLIDQLNSALREAGIERNSFGEKYSAYSLRHFYAVNALRNGVGVFEVARNTGTSVQMIQEYYGKQATSAVLRQGSGTRTLACSLPIQRCWGILEPSFIHNAACHYSARRHCAFLR